MRARCFGLAWLLAACSPQMPSTDAMVRDGSSDAGGAAGDAADARVINGNPHCVDGAPAVAYPPGPYEIIDDAVLPDMAFDDERGASVRLSQYFEPCAPRPKFLVLRAIAAWSGPSQWHASHAERAVRELGAGTQVLDLLVLGRENLPATAGELTDWKARFVPAANQRVVIDPEYRLRQLFIGLRQLPIIVVVDVRTMRASRVLVALDQHAVDEAMAKVLARAEGRPAPPHVSHGPNELSEEQWDMLRAIAQLPAPRPSPGNRHADNPMAASLGERFFTDPNFSAGGVACSTCHDLSRAFADARPVGEGVAFMRGTRNTPTVRYAAHNQWLFWDGRSDSLWSQALGPVENPVEMRSTRLHAAHVIYDRYRAPYEAVFGAMPALADGGRFPAEGKPGDASWEGMSAADRMAVDAVFANFGKAIEAYERTLRFTPSAADRYAMGDASALTTEQQAGLHHFFANGCIQCHHGPMLTDDSFHNIGMPSAIPGDVGDRGWIDGIARVRDNPFNLRGAFSDLRTSAHLERLPAMAPEIALGRMHTPGLRGVSQTGPWGHGGTFLRLSDVVTHYASDMVRSRVTSRVGEEDLHLGSFHSDAQTIRELSAFLEAL